MEKAFREGWTRGKKGPQRVTNPRKLPTRFIPAKFKTRSGTVSGEVRRNPKTGRVQIRVNPQGAKKLAKYARRVNPTTYGTSYFVSRSAAVRYYKDYEGSMEDSRRAVETKLREGSIHIGKPPLKAGQRLTTVDGGKRYAITEG